MADVIYIVADTVSHTAAVLLWVWWCPVWDRKYPELPKAKEE